MREYLPVVWTDEENFVGYLKSAKIYIVRFFVCIQSSMHSCLVNLALTRNFGSQNHLFCMFIAVIMVILIL